MLRKNDSKRRTKYNKTFPKTDKPRNQRKCLECQRKQSEATQMSYASRGWQVAHEICNSAIYVTPANTWASLYASGQTESHSPNGDVARIAAAGLPSPLMNSSIIVRRHQRTRTADDVSSGHVGRHVTSNGPCTVAFLALKKWRGLFLGQHKCGCKS